MPIVSEIELARVLKRHLKAVHQAVERGRLTPRPDGKFDLDQALQEWNETTHHEKGHNNRLAPELPTPEIPLRAETRSTDYAKARSATQIYQGLNQKLTYETRAGNLTPTADVETARFTEFRILREACMNIPARISALVAGETNVERCQQLLESELGSVFNAFADGKLA